MNDLHNDFDGWLQRGGREELARDVALHASACPGCLRAAGALDALTMVDPGLAEMPPLRIAPGRAARGPGLLSAVAGVVAVGLVIGAGIIAGVALFRAPVDSDVATVTPTQGGAVLGGEGSPQTSETASASPSASPTATPSDSPPPPAAGEGTPAPNPTMGGGPPPAPPGPAPTPRPSAPPPPPPTATPSPRPTPTPTPVPTPVPTPTPTPQCSDGIDNDGDLLIDFPVDPGCLRPEDNDESDA